MADPSKLDLLLEAEQRGILPAGMKPLLDEARRRGLVPGALPETEESRYRQEIDTEARRRQASDIPGEAINYQQATAGEMLTVGALPQIIAGARTGLGFLGDYGRERDILRRQIDLRREESGWGTLPGDIAGGFMWAPQRAAAAAARAPGYAGELWHAARVGAAWGGAYGFNQETGGWIDKIRNSIAHAAGGFVAAPAFRVGLDTLGRVTRPVRDAFRRWRQARADAAEDFEEAGVRIFAPALGGAAVRGAAEGLAGTITGSSLRAGARESIADLEARLAEELTGAGGRLTPAEAGEAAQGFLRRNVLERSIPKDQVDAMTPDELGRITPVGRERSATGEPVATDRERVLGQSAESYPTEIDAAYAASRQQAPRVQDNLLGRAGRPATPERQPRARTEALYTPEEIEDAVLAWEATRRPPAMPERLVDFIRRMGGIRDDSTDVRTIMGGANQRPGLISAAGRPLDDIGELAQQAGFFRERPTVAELLDRIDEDLRGTNPVVREADQDALVALREHEDIRRDLGRLGVLGARSARQVREILRGQRTRVGMEGMQIVTADGNTFHISGGRIVDDRAPIGEWVNPTRERTYYVDPQAAGRLAVPEGEDGSILDNGDGTVSLLLRRSGVGNKDRWAVQDTVPIGTEARVGLVPLSLWRGRTHRVGAVGSEARQSRQIYAAYELQPEVIEVIGQPAPIPGRPGVPPVATNTTRLLIDIAQEARGMLEMPGFRGQVFGEDGRLLPQVLDYLRPRLGDRIANMLAEFSERRATRQFTPGIQGLWNIRTMVGRAIDEAGGIEQRTMLQRLYDAIDRDIGVFVSRVPGGEVYLAQHVELSAAYRDFVENIRAPLQRILGQNVDPVAAIGQLVRATQRGGNINLLRAFYRVASDRGNRLTATGWLLHNMMEGGLPGFLRSYRALTEDARRIMFQGEARVLGERLDRLARVAGRLERLAPMTSPDYAVNPRRWAHLGNLGLGSLYFVSLPTLISTALGAEVASRLLASRWFARWYARAPFERGTGSQEWRQQVSRLIAVATESLGLNEPAAEALRSALEGSMIARAEAGERSILDEPEAEPMKPTLTGEENKPEAPAPRGPEIGPRSPSLSERANEGLRAIGVPRQTAERLSAAVPFTPPGAAYEAGRAVREGRTGDAAAEALSVTPLGKATVIGIVGARNLAAAGRPAAAKVLRMARELERRGEDVRAIRRETNRVIRREDPRLGSVVRLPDGQWGVELSNEWATFTPPPIGPPSGPRSLGPRTRLRDVLNDPELQQAYPQLGDEVDVFFNPRERSSSAWDAGRLGPGSRARIEFGLEHRDMQTALHETEHLVQSIEGFPIGANPRWFEDGQPYAIFRRANETPIEAYYRVAGEYLARAAEARGRMTAAERRVRPIRIPDDLIVLPGWPPAR